MSNVRVLSSVFGLESNKIGIILLRNRFQGLKMKASLRTPKYEAFFANGILINGRPAHRWAPSNREKLPICPYNEQVHYKYYHVGLCSVRNRHRQLAIGIYSEIYTVLKAPNGKLIINWYRPMSISAICRPTMPDILGPNHLKGSYGL